MRILHCKDWLQSQNNTVDDNRNDKTKGCDAMIRIFYTAESNNFIKSTSQCPAVSLDFLAKHVFSDTCQGLENSVQTGQCCTVSNIQQVSVFVLTDHLARLYLFMVGMAHKYNSLTANNVRRLFVHGFLTSRSPIFYQTGVGHGH